MTSTDRLVSRVLLVDPLERVLLLRFRIWDGPTVWIPPGGGVAADETGDAAARREVREETGIVVEVPLRLVWRRRTHYFQRDVLESYYLARLDETPAVVLEPKPGGPADLIEHGWWTAEAIAAAAADLEFTPPDLATRLAPLIAGDVPVEPVEIAD
ncbi:MAG: NUDIX domain-containing protein [Dehalococcoidia bacterium]|nr:NUDIX domain-containing protein [Dehalococcoidia bacterium]